MSDGNFPFFSVIRNKKTDEHYYCLIQTISKNYVSFFVLNNIRTVIEKHIFIELVDKWWKNSNDIPITIYYSKEFERFNYCKQHLSNIDYEIVSGFGGINLKNLAEKRIKRKVIYLE